MGRSWVVRGAVVALVVGSVVACGKGAEQQVGAGPTAGWQALPASPLSARADAVALWDGHEVLVFGGFDEAAARAASRGGLSTSTETVVATTPVASAIGAGVPPSTAGPAPSTTIPAGFPSDGAAYDPAAGTWRTLPAPPTPSGFVASAVAREGDRLTVLFTHGPGCSVDTRPANPAGAWYDRTKDAWVPIPPPSVPYFCPASAAWSSGRLWASLGGGWATFDPASASWQPMASPDPNSPCSPSDVHAVGQRLVGLGRRTVGAESYVTCATAFDPATGAWAAMPDPPLAYGTPSATGDDLFLVDNGTGDVADWNESSRSWRKLPDAPTGPRSGAVVTSSASSLVVWGGFDTPRRQGPASSFTMSMPQPERSDGAAFDRASGSWKTTPGGGVAPRQRAAAVTWGDTFFVWGGAVITWTNTGNQSDPLADGGTFTLTATTDQALPPPAPTTTNAPAPPPGSAVGTPTTPMATAQTAPAASLPAMTAPVSPGTTVQGGNTVEGSRGAGR